MTDPTGLGERGATLWAALSTGSPLVDAVALELARTADRLDELDNIIQGKGVLNLMQFRVTNLADGRDPDEPLHVEVKFNAVMSEAKGQQASLVSLATKYEALVGTSKPVSRSSPTPAELPANVSPLTSILDRAKRA